MSLRVAGIDLKCNMYNCRCGLGEKVQNTVTCCCQIDQTDDINSIYKFFRNLFPPHGRCLEKDSTRKGNRVMNCIINARKPVKIMAELIVILVHDLCWLKVFEAVA